MCMLGAKKSYVISPVKRNICFVGEIFKNYNQKRHYENLVSNDKELHRIKYYSDTCASFIKNDIAAEYETYKFIKNTEI